MVKAMIIMIMIKIVTFIDHEEDIDVGEDDHHYQYFIC
jgi:hypothetical protein